MKKLLALFVMLTLILLLISSCQRMAPPIQGELNQMKIPNLKGIPLDYGKFISVTNSTRYPGWVLLWFEDDEKNIRPVGIDLISGRINEGVTLIPRY